MINNKETEELIERYCNNMLNAEELKIFEQWLESDTLLLQSVNEHRIILKAFNLYASRLEFKKRLVLIHEETETGSVGFKTALKVVAKEPSAIIRFYRRHKIVSIAAAVSIVAVTGTLLTGALTGLFSARQQGAFQALRLEVERLKRSQRAIINGIQVAKETIDEPEVARGFVGSGMALTSNGYILTSYHVIRDAGKIYISNSKYEQLNAEEVYNNEELDIAILKVSDPEFKSFGNLPFSLKNSSSNQGERVFTLGYPREDVVYNEGSVSSCSGYEGDSTAYQVSIPVNPGNSGGPLFDNQANLVGIISGRNTGAEGASFAIQSKYIINNLKQYASENSLSLASGKNLKGLDRSAQIKKLKDYVFMVKVFNK